MWWIGFHAVLFWFLFADFYRNAYSARRAKREAESRARSAFFCCSSTGAFVEGMNSDEVIRRKNAVTFAETDTSYSATVKKGYKGHEVNGHNGHKGKDL